MCARKFLLLQGPATLFFRTLSIGLEKAGYDVWQVNFCGGDFLFNAGRKNKNFTAKLNEFPQWLKEIIIELSITDLLMFGDSRVVHKEAIRVANELNIKSFVFEEGYIRPDWVTFEASGVNANSCLMNKDIEWFKSYTHAATKKNKKSFSNLYKRFLADAIYRTANLVFLPFFSHYRYHRPRCAIIEYLGWAKRYPQRFYYFMKQEKRIFTYLKNTDVKYFFFPLQLNSDSQIRIHSNFGNMFSAIEYVLNSFAAYAPVECLLVIKNHPLDTGLESYRTKIDCLAESLNIKNRIIYVENGHIPTLTTNALGTVVVNSTVGMSALVHNNPTCVLGKAIYDLPGLTCQEDLDDFWVNPQRPDNKLFNNFKNAVINLTQINGNFYSKLGIEMLVVNTMSALGITQTVSTAIPNEDYEVMKS